MVDPIGTNVKGLLSTGPTVETSKWDPSKVTEETPEELSDDQEATK